MLRIFSPSDCLRWTLKEDGDMYKLRRTSLVYKIAFYWVAECDRKEYIGITRFELAWLFCKSCCASLVMMAIVIVVFGGSVWFVYNNFSDIVFAIVGAIVIWIVIFGISWVIHWVLKKAGKVIPIVDE